MSSILNKQIKKIENILILANVFQDKKMITKCKKQISKLQHNMIINNLMKNIKDI